MHWYNPDVATDDAERRRAAPRIRSSTRRAASRCTTCSTARSTGTRRSTGVQCPPSGGSATAPQLTPTDFTDWKMVTIRAPQAGRGGDARSTICRRCARATELVLTIPRVGFFTTPAFFANWQTNISNQMRVTMNQTLIVALGAQVDGTDATDAAEPPPGLDAAHARRAARASAATRRSIRCARSSSATYSWNYHQQLDPALAAQKGLFAFQRRDRSRWRRIDDFGAALAQHPLVRRGLGAEALLLRQLRAVRRRRSRVPAHRRGVPELGLLVEHAGARAARRRRSPPTRRATATATRERRGRRGGAARSPVRRARRPPRLRPTSAASTRSRKKQLQATDRRRSSPGLPSDGYGRGATMPVLPNEPTLFYRAGIENICAAIAAQRHRRRGRQAGRRRQALVERRARRRDRRLRRHRDGAGAVAIRAPRRRRRCCKRTSPRRCSRARAPSDALKSTFVAACLAPSAVSIGL